VKIDPHSHVPIYLQIVAAMRAAIAAGVYRPGEMLPSLRALGMELVVNPNTVQKAYDELEREGLIFSRRGAGIFVAKRASQSARSQAEETVFDIFKKGIQEARAADMPAERIQEIFAGALEDVLNHNRGQP
jgi:GntR family transcriptional regulator